MSAEVAEAIRQTRRTLAEKTWVPRCPMAGAHETCLVMAVPVVADEEVWSAVCCATRVREVEDLVEWNDRQTDVGAVLGMTLQALIAELCKPTLAQPAAAE